MWSGGSAAACYVMSFCSRHAVGQTRTRALSCLVLQDVIVVGSSMGASIIWAYIELYGEDRLAGAIFVDQVMHPTSHLLCQAAIV